MDWVSDLCSSDLGEEVTRNSYQDLKANFDELYGLLEPSTAPTGKGKYNLNPLFNS